MAYGLKPCADHVWYKGIRINATTTSRAFEGRWVDNVYFIHPITARTQWARSFTQAKKVIKEALKVEVAA